MAGDTAAALPLESDATVEGAALDLDEGIWRLQALASGYWSQETEVSVTRQAPAGVRLALWPAASLRGEIVAAEGETLPAGVEVRLSAITVSAGAAAAQQVPVSQPEPMPRSAELRCRIDKGSWTCVGPAGLFDVRLEASGYAPQYVWGVRLNGDQATDLGRTQLRRAASVFGRAVRKDGTDPPGPCRATLETDVQWRSGPGPDPDRAPQGESSLSAPLSQRGYFQMIGVLPGRHLLTVECSAASGLRELIVQADGETRIDPPLQLDELTLDVAVTPKLDPEGRPWLLSVEATSPRLRRIADKAATSADGRWIRHGLMAGNYRVAVSSSDGTPWLEQDIDLGIGGGPLLLRLASVNVTGQVTLGLRPVRARLVFSNQAGGEPVTLNSNKDGHFQGRLPIAPDAKETSWIVEAHVAEPPSTRRLVGINVLSVAGAASARLDLALPIIAVRGIVVSEDGQPQQRAQVTFENSGGGRTTTSTDDEGNFEMPELATGSYTAVAQSDDGASDRAGFDVLDGSEKELKLILHAFRRVSFYVVSSGEPVADAAVQVWTAPGTPQAFVRTDRNGRFEVKLPPAVAEVGLTVGEPGYALKMVRLPVPSESDPSQNGSQSANTVTLETSGGTLIVNFEPLEGTLPNTATVYLVHNGAIQDARTVAGWGSNQNGASGDDQAVVDVIEPGEYALCVLADPSELATIWGGAVPPDRCRVGTVAQGQTLTLQPR